MEHYKELKVGTKLVTVYKYNKWEMDITYITKVNEKSYSLDQKPRINKKTMMDKYKRFYTIPTQEQLNFINENNKKRIISKITQEFINNVGESIGLLETLKENNHLIELKNDAIEDIEWSIRELKELLEKGEK